MKSPSPIITLHIMTQVDQIQNFCPLTDSFPPLPCANDTSRKS